MSHTISSSKLWYNRQAPENPPMDCSEASRQRRWWQRRGGGKKVLTNLARCVSQHCCICVSRYGQGFHCRRLHIPCCIPPITMVDWWYLAHHGTIQNKGFQQRPMRTRMEVISCVKPFPFVLTNMILDELVGKSYWCNFGRLLFGIKELLVLLVSLHQTLCKFLKGSKIFRVFDVFSIGRG